MPKPLIETTLADIIVNSDVDSIAACAIGDRNWRLLYTLQNFGIEVNTYDYNPTINFPNKCVDFIIDDIILKEDMIVHFNVENTYPIGRVHKGKLLLVYDDRQHNGNCTCYEDNIHQQMAEDNLIDIEGQWTIPGKYKTHYVVLGTSK